MRLHEWELQSAIRTPKDNASISVAANISVDVLNRSNLEGKCGRPLGGTGFSVWGGGCDWAGP